MTVHDTLSLVYQTTPWRSEISLLLLISIICFYLSGSLFFDIIHYYFHRCSKSRSKWLRRIGYLHMAHHFYFNRHLQFNSRYLVHNMFFELPMECLSQLMGSWLSFQFATALTPSRWITSHTIAFRMVVLITIVRTLLVMIMSGRDSNHVEYQSLPKDPSWFWVGPQYHAMHHAYPNAYMSSVCRLFDWVAGTANSLDQKHVTMTGANSSFGRAMTRRLLIAGVKEVESLTYGVDWTYDDYSKAIAVLQNTDILVIDHGTKSQKDMMQGNYHSVVTLIDLFKLHQDKATESRRNRHCCALPLPEIWYVGSEAEIFYLPLSAADRLYCDSIRAFLPRARALYDDPSVIYRHIVPAAFSADWAASIAMWWISRGTRYIPVTYTGMAFVNYFKFLCFLGRVKDPR